MDSTFEKIRGFLAEQLGVDASQITMDSDLLNDFEADSLDIVDMVMTLEDEFGIEVPDEQVENVTVQELVDNLSMEPVNAFIAVDWLTKQPEEAKYALMRPWHGLEIPQELLQAMAEQDP